jgi:hypothetical protein
MQEHERAIAPLNLGETFLVKSGSISTRDHRIPEIIAIDRYERSMPRDRRDLFASELDRDGQHLYEERS